MFEDNGNKCGKCQNHDFEVLKKGHARDCPFKKCNCLKCRLLDARSDILQVISGKETKLKGTKKDPNCGFCQNHGVKILRKGHVRSCGFGQERHFRLDNCFDCEVHYIRNEVNRLQIKMRRAMKEDRALSEEQRRSAREPITRDEVEKVCDMARLARKKRESLLAQQVGETSARQPSAQVVAVKQPGERTSSAERPHCSSYSARRPTSASSNQLQLNPLDVWRPWSQHQVVAAIAAQQHQQLVNDQPQATDNQRYPVNAAPVGQLQVAHRHQLQHCDEFLPLANDLIDVAPEQSEQPLQLTQSNLQEQQLFNTLFRIIVAQFAQR